EEQSKNPLAVLPPSAVRAMGTPGSGPLVAVSAEMVGNYALKIVFSDGHDTGIYSWGYLREIDPAVAGAKANGPKSEGRAEGPR
ncbi:MAG: DUF971 domain-containing protein, partial [Phycisphaerales bacterium]|nr:DUF971 domain-containing protein [Phycisphaerales bacterium]